MEENSLRRENVGEKNKYGFGPYSQAVVRVGSWSTLPASLMGTSSDLFDPVFKCFAGELKKISEKQQYLFLGSLSSSS